VFEELARLLDGPVVIVSISSGDEGDVEGHDANSYLDVEDPKQYPEQQLDLAQVLIYHVKLIKDLFVNLGELVSASRRFFQIV